MKNDWENMIRQAIRDSGLSNYEIARRSGVSAAQLSFFMRSERGITIPTAEKIAEHIGVELTIKGVKNGKSKQKQK